MAIIGVNFLFSLAENLPEGKQAHLAAECRFVLADFCFVFFGGTSQLVGPYFSDLRD